MNFQKQTSSAKKTPGYAPEEGGGVSSIDLAANLDDPLYHHRAIRKLSVILEELTSVNATRTKQLRGSRALRRYIE
jgi:hypothetical protein